LKTRTHVEIPDANVKKRKVYIKTKSAEQVRYQFVAEENGTALYKLCSQKDYDAFQGEEIK
jgi:hypothetical protein